MRRSEALAVPGSYWDSDARMWRVDTAELDETGARVLVRLFPEHADAVPQRSYEEVTPVDLATPWAGDLPTSALLPNVDTTRADVLRRYQAVDLGFLAARMRQDGAGYNAWDRGLGKTLGSIVLVEELGSRYTIVVCPNTSKELVWAAEFKLWWPAYGTHSFSGTPKRRSRVLDDWREQGGALLVHYEALRLHDWRSEPVEFLIVDEAHRLQNGSASSRSPQFYKRLRQIKCDYKLMLSGSVTVNSPEDIFGALHVMWPKRYSSKWRDWNNRFMHYVSTESRGDILIGVKPERSEEMRNELAAFMVQRSKYAELADLPSRVDQLFRVELSPTQRRIYDDLADHFFADLPDGQIVFAPNVVSQLVKLRQVATGLDLLGETFTDSSKLDVAIDLVSDVAPRKSVVFCWHRATVDALVARLGARGLVAHGIHGGVSFSRRLDLVNDFQENPEAVAMVATLKTLGESVQLHAASDVIFVEQSWIPSDMEQAADRVHRHGQLHNVTVTTLVAADTIDEYRILPAVEDKLTLRRMVLGR